MLSSDNTTGGLLGSNGPWHGNFLTAPYDGSYRTAAMIWVVGQDCSGVSNEMLAAEDLMPTLAGLAGEAQRMPTDRPVDGVDGSAFMLGKSQKWRTVKGDFPLHRRHRETDRTAILAIAF